MSPSSAGVLADTVFVLHVGYVSYIVIGQLLILIGWLLKWDWVRNPWFRWSHVLMMTIVVFEVVMGITCPLTTWENELRMQAGQEQKGDSFIGRMMHDVIFIEAPSWVFTMLYMGFGAIILLTLYFCPPRRFKTK